MRSTLFAFAALLLIGCTAEAEDTVNTPEPALELTGRVVDAADVLSPEFEEEMTKRLSRLEEETLVQLVVATTPSLDGKPIAIYAMNLANAWGLGSAERNDGLLVLVAPNDRRVRIAVGLGLEETVTDEEAAVMMNEVILPAFGENDYEAGIRAAVESLADEVTPYELKEAA
ncbi:MAG: TPM domain-containing protein [Pseudomonadota bacterium]